MSVARSFAALIGAATMLPAGAAAQIAPLAGARLDVTAEGEVSRAPDLATISAGVVTAAASASAAMRANAGQMTAAIAALKRAGVADRDIRTASLNLSPQYRYVDNQPPVLTGYQASNQVAVRFRDIARAGAILDTLVGQGVNQINGPDFSVDQPDAALDEARSLAIAKARARAELYARATNMRVKRIVSISEAGGYSPPPRPMMAMAMREKAADTPIAAGEQKLGVSVSVTFELE